MDVLTSPEGREAVKETYECLKGSVLNGIEETPDDTLRHALDNNAFIFSGLKTYHSLQEVGLSLTDNKGNIKPYSEFQKDVLRINEQYNRNYLRAEYNHAVAASQMAAKWQSFEQEGEQYDLQYRTAGDDRVREEHAALDGITLPPSDPFWDRYLPPNGWNCRCTAVQVRKGKYPHTDPATAMDRGDQCTAEPKKQIFRFNPGKTLNLFPPKHPYYKAPQEVKQGITRYALNITKNETVKEVKAKQLEPYKEKSDRFVYGNIYCGNSERAFLIQHIEDISLLPVALDIDNILQSVSNGQVEDIVPSHMTKAKEKRRVVKYTKYIFNRKVRIDGKEVTKTLQLKCEVRQVTNTMFKEYPYSIREVKE